MKLDSGLAWVIAWLIDRFLYSRIYEDTPVCSRNVDHFADVPIDDLFSIARPMAKKARDLHPISGSLLTTNLDVLMPVITGIVNLSLKSGSMSAKLKEAVLKSLLKKPIKSPSDRV